MSHVDVFATDIKDIACLKAAVEQVGGVMTNDKTYRWYNTHVGDYPLPKGFTVADMGKCDYRIRFDGIGYDIGVVKSRTKPNEYVLIADFFGPGRVLPDKIKQIKVEYAVQAALAWAKAKGYRNVRVQRASNMAQVLIDG